jgi:hypothetical protein
MGDNAVSCRAAGWWRGKAPHAVTAAAVGAVIALTGAACSTVTSGTSSLAKAPVVTVLKQGASNGNGDIFITPGGGSVSGTEIISNTGKVIWFHPLPAHELTADFRPLPVDCTSSGSSIGRTTRSAERVRRWSRTYGVR